MSYIKSLFDLIRRAHQHFLPFIFILILGCNSEISDNETHTRSTSLRPNIIYILADDLGYGDLGCFGQSVFQTPHIDALAANGMKFLRHYSGSTVCAPSRASLLTGKHTGHTTIRGNQSGQLLPAEEITLPELLKSAGYFTGCIGKWGVGHPPPVDDPLKHGFDQAFGYINMWHAHNFYPEFLYRNGEKELLAGNKLDQGFEYRSDMPEGAGIAKEYGSHAHLLFENEALEFIETYQDTSFFLYLSLNVPHANNEAGFFMGDGMEVPSYGAYATQTWPNPEKGFAAMIELLDATVGKIQGKLAQLDLSENTIVVFTSDNGPHQEGGHQADFFNSNGPLRGMKRDLYEGGLRVPTIFSWPGMIARKSSTQHLSAFWDILPTFCEIAGVAIPPDTDGISFLPTLLGDPEKQEHHSYLYWEFYGRGGKQAILKDEWKLIKSNLVGSANEVTAELYNLVEDPSETYNQAKDQPEKVAELEQVLKTARVPLPGAPLVVD